MQFWLPIIIKEGLPAAYRLWQLVTSGKEPTEADWQELMSLSDKTAQDYLDAAGKPK